MQKEAPANPGSSFCLELLVLKTMEDDGKYDKREENKELDRL